MSVTAVSRRKHFLNENRETGGNEREMRSNENKLKQNTERKLELRWNPIRTRPTKSGFPKSEYPIRAPLSNPRIRVTGTLYDDIYQIRCRYADTQCIDTQCTIAVVQQTLELSCGYNTSLKPFQIHSSDPSVLLATHSICKGEGKTTREMPG